MPMPPSPSPTCQSGGMSRDQLHAADALTGLLMPFWQLVIGAFVLVILVAAAYRLAQPGRWLGFTRTATKLRLKTAMAQLCGST